MSVILKEKPKPDPRPDLIEGVPVKVTERDVLHRAADLLESGEWGWCQGFVRNGDNLCALGAIAVAAGDVLTPRLERFSLKHSDLSWSARELFVVHNEGGACWNDAPGRTREEVIAALRKAAELV